MSFDMKKLLYLIICALIFVSVTGSVSRLRRFLTIDSGGLTYSSGDAILMENGSDAILLELGDKILVE